MAQPMRYEASANAFSFITTDTNGAAPFAALTLEGSNATINGSLIVGGVAVGGADGYAPVASPTFTGTITAPPGSISASSISGLAASATTDATNAGNISSGTLAVAHGGTGVTTSTGSDSVVLSASPTLSGVPLVPTAAVGSSNSQIANTAFVTAAIPTLSGFATTAYVSSVYAPTASPTFTGTITAPPGSISASSISGLAVSATTDATNAGNISSGTLAVAHGGTGTTTSTGSDSVVLSASPTLSGVPLVPTAAVGSSNTQIASTAFVSAALTSYAPLVSPALTGVPVAPTPTTGTNTTQIATTAFVNTSISSYGMFRNRIINGDMRVDQRGSATTPITTSGSYATDRWQIAANVASGTFTLAQIATGSGLFGFQKALRLVGTSINVSSAGNYVQCVQNIEGTNMSDMMFGTAAAQSCTMSFWVYGPAGTFSVSLRNGANNRSFIHNYTISSANTWQLVSFTVVGDTTGTWAADNTSGLSVQFTFGCGSTYQTTTTDAWQAGTYSGTSSTSSIGSNTVYITGVQVEKGAVATPFEYRPYAIELQLAQRYFCKTYDDAVLPGTAGAYSGCLVNMALNTYAFTNWQFPVCMRADPTVTVYSPNNGTSGYNYSGGVNCVATTQYAGTKAVQILNNNSVVAGYTMYSHAAASADI